MTDKLILGGHEFTSRFILGSGKYSLDLINAAVQNAGAEIITLALRRANQGGTANILDYIPEGVTLLPNTSGARTADEAVRIARLSRECGCGDFVKIEIMRDSKYLLPDNQETIRATEILAKEARTRVSQRAISSRSSSTRSIFRSSLTPASAVRRRRARRWRWARRPSWRTPPSRPRATSRQWLRRSRRPSRQAARLTLPVWAVYAKPRPPRLR